MFEQDSATFGTDAGDGFEAAGQAALSALRAVAGDGEAVRFISGALDQVEGFAAAWQEDGPGRAGQVDFFDPFCQ